METNGTEIVNEGRWKWREKGQRGSEQAKDKLGQLAHPHQWRKLQEIMVKLIKPFSPGDLSPQSKQLRQSHPRLARSPMPDTLGTYSSSSSQ